MDESFESPSSTIGQPKDDVENAHKDVEQSSDEDEDGPDWTKLPTALALSTSRPVIPKRGEKDHEPAAEGETRLQSHILERARTAMFVALRAERASSSKSISYGIWYPSISRAVVPVARGIHFTTLGHSVARASQNSTNANESLKPASRRLELLPEEALYLVERGAIHCVHAQGEDDLSNTHENDTFLLKPPMSVQQAFSDMIGTEGLTLERYQVYAYLKRLGYVVTRSRPPSSAYPTPTCPHSSSIPQQPKMSISFMDFFTSPFRTIMRLSHYLSATLFSEPWVRHPTDWWKPLIVPRKGDLRNNGSLFNAMRELLPSLGYSAPLRIATHKAPTVEESPYHIFFNLYKPSTPFKKSTPPEPDFQIVVINARTTPMPTLLELTALFDGLPITHPPAPRKRLPPPSSKSNTKNAASAMTKAADAQAKSIRFVDEHNSTPATTSLQTLFGWIRSFFSNPLLKTSVPARITTRPNPFPILKQGKKIVIIAVVDAGNVGFFRLGQGAFEEWPMA